MIRTFLMALLSSAVTLAGPASVGNLGALYSMTNDPSGNNILIYAIGLDGTLSYTGAVSTGGAGMRNNDPVLTNPLFSQGSIVVSGDHLYAVNAGSNTVSMFLINPTNPLDVRMVGKPVQSGGEFPVSVAVSPKTGDVCVLNSGKVNGVTCLSVDPTYGMKANTPFQPFGRNITTPPALPADTPSQVLFSPDGSRLRASVKGTGPDDIGFMASWEVASDGSISPSYVKSTPPQGSGGLPYGMIYVVGAENAILVTDPALGLTIYDYSKAQTGYIPLAIEGELATCWVVYSEATSSYFMTDPDNDSVYEVSVDQKTLNSTLLNTYQLTKTSGPTDLVAGTIRGKEYLYILAPRVPGAPTFDVFALKKGGSKMIQSYNLENAIKGVRFDSANLVGAAVYTT